MFSRGERDRVIFRCTGPTRTKQEFKAECQISTIVRRFTETGVFTHVAPQVAQYGDFSNVTTFQEAISRVDDAQSAFMALPAHTRARMDNSPQRLLEFLADEANRSEALDLGLLEAKADVPPGVPSGEEPASTPGPNPEGGGS